MAYDPAFFCCCICCCRILLSAFKNDATNRSFREKRLSPRQAPRLSLLPHSPWRTQVRLKPLLFATWLTPDLHRAHGRPSVQECRLRLKRPTPHTPRRSPPFKSSTAKEVSMSLWPILATYFGPLSHDRLMLSCSCTTNVELHIAQSPLRGSVAKRSRYPADSQTG